jgi:hypothetical protein
MKRPAFLADASVLKTAFAPNLTCWCRAVSKLLLPSDYVHQCRHLPPLTAGSPG